MSTNGISRESPRGQPANDPIESAKAAGLRYVSDTQPGIRRQRAGSGFTYVDVDGKRVDDEDVARIKRLAIPPAWTDGWICSSAAGHLQATGRDARGHKQYKYHPRYREIRDETKYGRMVTFAKKLPGIRRRIDRDLRRKGLPREKVLAAVVRLLEMTLIRVGNEEYARSNGSFGLTTMRNRHVELGGSKVFFQFRGKGGKQHKVALSDRRLAEVVRRCRDLPGKELFQYVDDDGETQAIDSGDVNEYLREISGEDFTAKDFRTWAGTVLAAQALSAAAMPANQAQAKRNVVAAIEMVAERLGNTVAICRKCYVHPAIVESYMEGAPVEGVRRLAENGNGFSTEAVRSDELAVAAFLKKWRGANGNGRSQNLENALAASLKRARKRKR
ncbi:MAG TPA: DNA topoisomerase IB [Dehalococcoidia bacterium]|nr:DNA topoisomerase IB [Dehalococcoidia bacterium]